MVGPQSNAQTTHHGFSKLFLSSNPRSCSPAISIFFPLFQDSSFPSGFSGFAHVCPLPKMSGEFLFILRCVCVCVCVCARAHLVVSDSFVTPRTVARQASLSAEFSKQEYCGELPFSTPGNLPNPGIELASLASPALTGRFFTTVPPGKPSPLLCGVQPSSSVIALLPSQITVHAFIINIIFYTLCAP